MGKDATSWGMRILGMIGWVVLVGCLVLDPASIVMAGERQGWLRAFKFPHKEFILQAFATLAFVGLTYHFVPKLWRDLVIVASLAIVQVVKMPALLTEPGRIFQKALAEMAAFHMSEVTIGLVFNTLVIVFFAGLFVVGLCQGGGRSQAEPPWMRRDGAGLG